MRTIGSFQKGTRGDVGMNTLARKIQITVPCSADHLSRVREAVRGALLGSRLSGTILREIVAGVDEAVSEVMMRSYVVDVGRELDLEITLDDERVQVSIKNDGACFDPAAPAVKGAFPSLGIELIRRVFDDIRHTYSEQGVNHLVLARKLGALVS